MQSYPDVLDYSEEDMVTDWLPGVLQNVLGYCKVFFAKEKMPGTASETDRVMLEALNSFLRCQAMNATDLVKDLLPVMSRYWRDQWSTKKRALKEELVQSVRIFIRCGYVHDHAEELSQLMERYDMPALRTGIADSAAGRGRGGQEILVRFDRWKFAYCDFAADIFHCLYSQQVNSPAQLGSSSDAAAAQGGRDEADQAQKRPRISDAAEDEEIFHKCPPISKFVEPSQDSQVWFQILFAMISKYPAIIDAESCLTMLQVMCSSLNRMQEFGDAQAWMVLNLRQLLYIEDQLLDSGQVSLASASTPSSESQSSENSQRAWERKSEARASRAGKRKELWQAIWAGCVSAVKACADVGVMRELLMLLEAVMLTDRVSSLSVLEADDLFSWDAHVIKHPSVLRAVWRFLFVRVVKYPIDERKSADTLAWICTNLKHAGDHLHENGSMAATFLAVVAGLTQSSVTCAELVGCLSTPVLASPVDLRPADRTAEKALQMLNEHTILFDQSLEVKSLVDALESHAMDRYFFEKLSVGNLTDPHATAPYLPKLVNALEAEVAKFGAVSVSDEAQKIKNLCSVCILQIALRGCACRTDKLMQTNLVEIRRKFEGMFGDKRLWEARTQLEALKSLDNVLLLFQTLDIMSVHTTKSHTHVSPSKTSAILRDPIKLLSQSFVRYAEECQLGQATSLAAADDTEDGWGGSTAKSEVSHTVMVSLTQVLMRLASLLCDDGDLHGQDGLYDSLVRIMMAEVTQYGTVSCLEALDVNFPRLNLVAKLMLGQLQEATKDKANLPMFATWSDCVMRACQVIYTSCPGFIVDLTDDELGSVLLLFRVLGKNKSTDDEGKSYSVRTLSRQGRRAFGNCFRSLLMNAGNKRPTADHRQDTKFLLLAGVAEGGVGETMLHLLRDADFGVRAHMADVITILAPPFLDCEEISVAVEEFVPAQGELESQCTTVLTLGKLATKAEPLERDLLFVLLNFAAGKTAQDEIFCLVKNVISEVAQSRGHASASDLCGWHMHSWLRTWTAPCAAGTAHRNFACLGGVGQRAENFPYEVCGIDTLQDFFALHRGVILLECCLAEDAAGYKRVLLAVNGAARAEVAVVGHEISELYPYLHAHYLLSGTNHPTAALDAFLDSNFAEGLISSKVDLKQIQRKQRGKILISMFASVCPDSEELEENDVDGRKLKLSVCDHWLEHVELQNACAKRGPSEFPAQTLRTLMAQETMASYRKQLCEKGSGAEIVAKIHEELCGGLNRLATKVNLLCALMLCVQQLDRRSTEPYVHRYVIHICVQHLASPEVRNLCRAILIKVCSVDMKHNEGLNTAQHMRDVVSTLASSTVDFTNTDDSAYIAELIQGAKAGGLQNVRDALEAVTPLPAKLRVDSATVDAVEDLRRASTTNSLESELQRFVLENSADPTSQLSHLQQFLHSTIGDHMSDTSNSILDLDEQTTHLVSQCIWKLINMCGSGKPAVSGPNSVEQLASACLGELGPVCSHLISFSSNRKNDEEASTNELARNVKILLMLDGYQIESSKNVVQTARHTLCAVLDEEKGKQAFGWLREHNDPRHKYMEVHYTTTAERFAPPQWMSIDNPDIWATHDKSYSEWVCGLCSACIAYSCDDPVLAKCFELCQFKDDFAEYILPYAVCDAVKMGGRDGMAMEVFSKYIGECLKDLQTSRQRSIELLLRVLNLLRRMRVDEVVRSWKQTSKLERNSRGRRGTAKGNTVYFLDIDYLIAAKAALGCDAYFTALLYVEQHSEQKNGQVVPLENSGMPKIRLHHEERPEEELLLQRIYSSINEPDGFYGVNNSLNIRQRIQGFEHERGWDKALGAYDSLLGHNRSHSAAAGTGRASPVERTTDDVNLRTGLMSSLQKMGYMHTLSTYCRGAAGQISPGESFALQEYQYEGAWRACRWDEQLGHQLLEKGMPLGFHASIFKCIQALKGGDHDTFTKMLETGRLSAIQELRATSLESTKNVYSTLSKLQLYVVAEDALQVSKATSKADQARLAQQWCKNVVNRENSVREHFAFVEPVIALQASVLDALDCQELIPDCLVDLASCARKAKRFPVAASALEQLFGNGRTTNPAGLLEEARGLWAQGDDDKAVGLARYIIEDQTRNRAGSADTVDKAILSDALRLAGKWMASNRSESTDVITRQCLIPAIEEAERLQDDSRSLKAKYVMATYCEKLFRTLPSLKHLQIRENPEISKKIRLVA